MMKKKSGKRFLSWLLAAVMIIALMPATAFAEPPTESSGNTEPAVTAYCPSSEGGTDVSVGEYDSSPAAETKDTPTEEPAKDTPAEEPVKESPVEDKTTEGAPAQVGAVENSTDEKITKDLTNEVSAAELAGLTAMLGAPVPMEIYANKSYPIYVYGYFVNGKDKNDEDNILSGKDGLFGKDIKIQKDNKKVQTVKWNDYSIIGKPKSDYITFGKIENGTTVKPTKKAEKESISDNDLEAMLTDSLGNDTDKQNSYFSWKDVAIEDWDLHISHGATDYPDEDGKYTWHMDGKIHTYKIKYMNGKSDVSQNATVDKDTYYCGTYTIADYEPQAPKGKVFAGWTVNGETNSGKYYQGGDTIILKDHDTDNTGKITLEAQWEDLPVYVYGCFKHKGANNTDENLGSTAALYVNGKQVNWNPDNAKGEYYITFGKLANATNADPSDYSSDKDSAKISTAAIEQQINDGKVALSNDAGSAKANGLLENNDPTNISKLVSSWSGLKSRAGAASYAEETADKQTWHLDGTIYLYKVTYKKGNDIPDNEAVTLPTETTYFLGDYTVREMETSSQNYKFLGWEYNGKTYQEGEKITAPNQDITLTAKWEKKPVVYKVNYDWGTSAPSDEECPTNGNSYNTEAEVPMDTTFDENSTSNAKNGEQEGHWTFSGWTKEPNIQTEYGDDVITKTITYKGTWTFKAKPITTTYRVVYEWDGAHPSVTPPSHQDFTSLDDAKNAVNTAETNFTSNDYTEGTWSFDGWNTAPTITPDEDSHITTVTFKGTWTLTKYQVTYSWSGNDGVPSDFVDKEPQEGLYNTEAAARTAIDTVKNTKFTSTVPKGDIAGSWNLTGWTETPSNSKDGHVTTVLIALTGTWNFTPSETKTITGVLNGLVQKEFKSQHGYSTEGTFTATAEVIAKPVVIVISSTDKEMEKPTEAKIYDGTVTLKTGDTKQPFTFSARDKMADVLTPNTRYTVKVSENKGTLSKVIYDETVYTITFTTRNNEVSDIQIVKENDISKPETVDKITFKNIYTYKKHRHSSGDDGNGGSKKEEKPTVEIKDDDALGLNNTDHFAYIVGYGNGEVRPQNSITRAEVAAIFFRLLEDDVRDANYTRQNKFTDVSNDAWYCSAVSTLSAMGIISGYPDATFRPNASITRAEFAAIATRFDVNGDKTPASFNDIAGHWAKDEIAVAANNGWVNGYEDGSFRPQNKITRAETMSLVNRVLNRKPETAEDLLENMTKWTDNADTNAWYYLAVQEATNSHYYEYKEKSQYEKWTELRETRDWSELDK